MIEKTLEEKVVKALVDLVNLKQKVVELEGLIKECVVESTKQGNTGK